VLDPQEPPEREVERVGDIASREHIRVIGTQGRLDDHRGLSEPDSP
jgi:hypothetical protein